MKIQKITSTQNPHFKSVVRLNEKRERDKTGLFLIEGFRQIERACQGKQTIEEVWFAPSLFLGENECTLLSKCESLGASLIEVPSHLLEKLAYRDRPEGLMAVAQAKNSSLKDLILQKDATILVLEKIEKPGNLGTMLRSADAAGATAVIVADPITDIYNPNVVRSSVGTLFTIPVFQASNEETLSFLRQEKVQICAASPHAQKFYTEIDLQKKTAFVMGSEQLGLSPFWMGKADVQTKIPMLGIADSLNVASAATLLLYEAVRQKSLK